jgi:hypothetical protein
MTGRNFLSRKNSRNFLSRKFRELREREASELPAFAAKQKAIFS